MANTSREKGTLYDAFVFTFFFSLMIAACHFTEGYAVGALALFGCYFIFVKQFGKALSIYLLIPLLSMINPLIIPKGMHFYLITRLSVLLMTGGLILTGSHRYAQSRQQIPLLGIFFFLVVALISSIQGWFPLISYFKIINFAVFILGIYEGTKNIHRNPDDVRMVRASLLAIAIIIIFGSLAVLPFPAIAYMTSLSDIIREEGVEAAAEQFSSSEKMGLFCGITNQSQFLGPALACIGGWVLCDMLLVERRVTLLHMALLAAVPPMLFMTRSRAGFFAFVVLLVMVWCYCLPAARLTFRARRHVRSLMFVFLAFLAIGVAVLQIRNRTVSRLLRKTDDVIEDNRSFWEALTNSRQGLIERCMGEFHRNPLLGSGFQVVEEHRDQFLTGQISYFSAPIEKGILPLMVLGETGIVGFVVFILFLITFYLTCFRRRYAATLTLFTVFLATNMAEGTFFSPSGSGGVEWVVTVVGGFAIDMNVLLRAQRDEKKNEQRNRVLVPEVCDARPIHRVHLNRIELPDSIAGSDAAADEA